DAIFKALSPDHARQWRERFLAAIQPGADLSRVLPRVLLRIQRRNRERVIGVPDLEAPIRAEVVAAIDGVCEVLAAWSHTGVVDVAAAEAAKAAAVSAASAV